MSPQITFKSTQSRAPAPGEALTDSAGRPVPPAPSLGEIVLPEYRPSHGGPPDRLPAPPYGLSDLGPAAALRVIGPEREAWMQGMQTADVASIPLGGAAPALFLGGKGRLVAEGLLWRFPEELIVTTLPERLDALHEHLDKLLIMEDCELSRAQGLHRLRFAPRSSRPVRGPDGWAAAARARAPGPGRARVGADCRVAGSRPRCRGSLARRAGGACLGQRAGRGDDARRRRARPADLLRQGLLRGTGSGRDGHVSRSRCLEPRPPSGSGRAAGPRRAARSFAARAGQARARHVRDPGRRRLV